VRWARARSFRCTSGCRIRWKPTPISALIHRRRWYGGHLHGPAHVAAVRTVRHRAVFLIIIGAITAFFMGLLGIVQNDIKRVVAYSNAVAARLHDGGAGASPIRAIFHLMTHAFFKACCSSQRGRSSSACTTSRTSARWCCGRRCRHLDHRPGGLAGWSHAVLLRFYSKDSIILARRPRRVPARPARHRVLAFWPVC